VKYLGKITALIGALGTLAVALVTLNNSAAEKAAKAKAGAKSEVVEQLRPIVNDHAREIERLRQEDYRMRREVRDLRDELASALRSVRRNWRGAPHHRPAPLVSASSLVRPEVHEDMGPPLPPARLGL